MNIQARDMAAPAAAPDLEAWRDFQPGAWSRDVNVRDFILSNVTPYEGDKSFLSGATQRTDALFGKVKDLQKAEIAKGGVLDVDASVCSSIVAHAPGYIDRELEQIVGLQTDAPLKRAIMPFGGYRMVKSGLSAYGFKGYPELDRIFPTLRKTHNDGCVRRLHARGAEVPQVRHHHRPARRLWPRPHHRRLPPRRALRRRPAARRQGGAGQELRTGLSGRVDPAPARGDGRADPRAEGTGRHGQVLRLRRVTPGGRYPRGDPVDLSRLPRRREGSERRGPCPSAACRASSTSMSSATSPRAR